MTKMTKRTKRTNPAYAIKGVYAITPDCADTADLLHRVRLALAGGVRILQYRNKLANTTQRLEQAHALRKLLSLAQNAVHAGADYVAFGAFFPSTIKPNAVVADIELLQQARAELSVPLVAIGGITLHNAASLVHAGADALAVITALFDAEDITAIAKKFAKLFNPNLLLTDSNSISKVKQACPEPGRRGGDERATKTVHTHG